MLLLGLPQPLLEAVDVAFERVDGRLGGLRAAHQSLLAALGRAARAAFGEQVALAATRAGVRSPLPACSFPSGITRPGR